MLSIFLLSLLGLLQMNDTTELVFAGDAMQHGPQLKAAAQADGTFDYSDCFSLLEDDIKSAHFAVVNLECPLGGEPYKGYPIFSCPDDFARQLKKSGFDLLLTANNHCMDSGGAGLKRTIKALDEMGVAHMGTYLNEKDRQERLPMIMEINGLKIAFLTYTYGTNGIPVPKLAIVDLIEENKIKNDVQTARENGAELVCVCMHWGNEYEQLPSVRQQKLAQRLEEMGVELVIGSHPHVVQPMELSYDSHNGTGMAIVYSLGNFISNQNDLNSRGGAMVTVKLAEYDNRPVVLDVKRELLFCQKPLYGKGNYKLIPCTKSDSVRADSKTTFEQFMRNAENLFRKHNKNID